MQYETIEFDAYFMELFDSRYHLASDQLTANYLSSPKGWDIIIQLSVVAAIAYQVQSVTASEKGASELCEAAPARKLVQAINCSLSTD